jgi:hypothetical protein
MVTAMDKRTSPPPFAKLSPPLRRQSPSEADSCQRFAIPWVV